MKTKFEVGDKVVLKDRLIIGKKYGRGLGFEYFSDMKFDKPMAITSVYDIGTCKLGNDYFYPFIMLKKVEIITIKRNVMEDLISGEIF